jgi:hypothetical protein
MPLTTTASTPPPAALPLRRRARAAWALLRGARLDPTLDAFLGDRADGQARSDAWGLTSGTLGPEPLAPHDLPWASRQANLADAFSAWRTNPLARRIVALTTDYVLGHGAVVDSARRDVARWVRAFWHHRQNQMTRRLPLMLDEQTRAGELFVVLHRNPVDGLSYVRHIPAASVPAVRWRAGDYEQLTEIGERAAGEVGLRWWPVFQPDAPEATASAPAVVLHFPVNRPVGAARGEGDLDPILYWLQQYSAWLDGRAQLNQAKSSFYYDVEVAGTPQDVQDARARYRHPPAKGSVVVHSQAEKHTVQKPNIGADDAEADGRALRLMVAAGAHIPLHFLSEVMAGTTLGSSVQMNEPAYRHYAARQAQAAEMLRALLGSAYQRAAELGHARPHADLKLSVALPEIQRDDNQPLAEAARDIAQAFATMKAAGLDRDGRAVRLIYKFAGELLSEAEVEEIVAGAEGRGASGA